MMHRIDTPVVCVTQDVQHELDGAIKVLKTDLSHARHRVGR